MNFTRQMELYNPDEERDLLAVIGAGATGSWVSLALNKLGVYSLDVFDDDLIEAHNVPNQLYGKDDVEKFKVKSLRNIINNIGTGVGNLNTYTKHVEKDDLLAVKYSTVFCLVDSMETRKELYYAAVEYGTTKYWIETRMGLTGYRLYLVDLQDEYQRKKYEETLYSDEDAEVSACGASQSVISTAMQCASHAVGLWLALKNGAEYIPNEIILDVHSSLLLSRKFEEKKEKDNESKC